MIVRFATGEGQGQTKASLFMVVRDDTTSRFSTGSAGYNANGKVMIEGRMYQVSCNLIAIGSKDTPSVDLSRDGLKAGETRTESGAILGE